MSRASMSCVNDEEGIQYKITEAQPPVNELGVTEIPFAKNGNRSHDLKASGTEGDKAEDLKAGGPEGSTGLLQTSVLPTNNMNDIIHAYVTKNKPFVYILTPCFGGMCYINYMICLMNTMDLLKHYHISVKVEFCRNDSLVTRARNNLIAKAMNHPETTHIMFIDNDISWDPMDIIKLLLTDKELIGGIYPLKQYQWDRILKDPMNPYNTNLIQTTLARKNHN